MMLLRFTIRQIEIIIIVINIYLTTNLISLVSCRFLALCSPRHIQRLLTGGRESFVLV